MATHSGILAWRSPWTEESGGLYSPWSLMGLSTHAHMPLTLAFYTQSVRDFAHEARCTRRIRGCPQSHSSLGVMCKGQSTPFWVPGPHPRNIEGTKCWSNREVSAMPPWDECRNARWKHTGLLLKVCTQPVHRTQSLPRAREWRAPQSGLQEDCQAASWPCGSWGSAGCNRHRQGPCLH